MNDNLDNKDEFVSEKDNLDNESDTNSEEYTEVKSTNTNNSNNNNEFREKIIKMFGVVIIALIVVLVVGFLISLVSKKNYSYATVEEKLKNAAINYFKDNKNKLPKNSSEIVEIDSNILVNNKYMKSLDKYLKDDSCTGKVAVEKIDGKSYSYTPKITCKDYTTTKFSDAITKNSNVVTSGFGVYNINNEYVYRGSEVNNYVRFNDSEKVWRVVKVTSNNEIVLISNDKTRNIFKWDEKYNNEYGDNYGINIYKNSYISTILKKLYANSLNDDEEDFYNNEEADILTKEEKTKIVEFNACVGKRSESDTSRDGSAECQTVEKTKMSLLSTYDFLNASLDTNCNSITKPDCQNYNYLISDYNYWLANGSAESSSKVYRVTSYGYIQSSYANVESYARVVIRLSENTMLVKGKGTKNNPYVIR